MLLPDQALPSYQPDLAPPDGPGAGVWRRFMALGDHPLPAVALSVLGFAFLGPVAALVVVATMLDHEFAHRFVMRRLGYQPGPVRIVPLVGAFVKAKRPMLRSADIALIYLAGPLAGILSAAVAALVGAHFLDPLTVHQVYVGAAVSVALNLFNLLPLEPLDGGLVSRALPYPFLLLFPGVLAVWLVMERQFLTPAGLVIFLLTCWLAWQKVRKWQRYLWLLRTRERWGDLRAMRELLASLEVPLRERLLVVTGYIALVTGALALFLSLARAAHWIG